MDAESDSLCTMYESIPSYQHVEGVSQECGRPSSMYM